jgi:hypothetical protein
MFILIIVLDLAMPLIKHTDSQQGHAGPEGPFGRRGRPNGAQWHGPPHLFPHTKKFYLGVRMAGHPATAESILYS